VLLFFPSTEFILNRFKAHHSAPLARHDITPVHICDGMDHLIKSVVREKRVSRGNEYGKGKFDAIHRRESKSQMKELERDGDDSKANSFNHDRSLRFLLALVALDVALPIPLDRSIR